MAVALALESGGVVKGVDVVAKRVEAAWRLAESASLDSSRVRPWDPASRFEDVEGGLNRMRAGEFLRGIENAGLATDALIFNCQLRRWPPLRALSSGLMRVPWVRDYFAFSAYGVFRRA